MSATVRDVLNKKKRRTVYCIDAKSSVFEAIQLMSLRNVSALPVLDHRGRIVGMISEREYTRDVILKDRSSRETLVADVMRRDVRYVSVSDQVDDCMRIMVEDRARHLLVRESGDDSIGIVSMGDLVNEIVSDREFLIQQLVCYITGDQKIDTGFAYSTVNQRPISSVISS